MKRRDSAKDQELSNGRSKLNYLRNKTSAKKLASEYTLGNRILEIVGICGAALLNLYIIYMLVKHFQPWNSIWIVISLLLGMLLADFFSGLGHWLADSYGSIDFPVFGKSFIRPFREHHIDPLSVTRHDFIETNGDNCFVMLPLPIAMTYFMYYQTEEEICTYYPIYCFLTALGILIMLTNQFHKWAHTAPSKLPPMVLWLQKYHVILPPRHHQYHHEAPHETHFCPCNGWCNYPLQAIGFWVGIESAIEKITGVKPRTDDFQWAVGQE